MATWLELTLCSLRHEQPVIYRIHELKSDYDTPAGSPSFAISLNGRWLCSTNGRLTVFRGREAAEHFMSLLNVSCLEAGEPLQSWSSHICDADCVCHAAGNADLTQGQETGFPLPSRRLN